MKKAVAIIGILLIAIPLVRIGSMFDKMNNANSSDAVVDSMYGIVGGLMLGFFALVLLGFLCDGGKGFKPLWLLVSMTVIGALWITTYPAGWLLGIPLCIYSGEKLFRVYASKRGSNQSSEPTG